MVRATAFAILTSLVGAAAPIQAGEEGKARERLGKAAQVLDEALAAPDRGLPQDLLDRAQCAAVIPSMKKAGLGLGGRYGKGAVSCRKQPGGWSAPAMITLGGGSIGLQIGASAVDVVMLVMNRDGIPHLLKSQFSLGGDASVAAGPVGRAGTAETDALMSAKILTWSRSRGVFAGLEIKGALVQQDRDENEALYGRRIEARDILLGEQAVAVPAGAQVFVGTLTKHSPRGGK